MSQSSFWQDVLRNTFVWFYHMTPALLVLMPGLVAAAWARSRLRRALREGSAFVGIPGMTGEAMAVRILQQGHIDSVSVEPSSGPLANFYDWRRRQLRLSKEVCGGPTVALVAIAAHEAGYVLQPLWLSLIRTLTTFAVRLGAIGAWLIFAAGLLLDSGFIALFGSAIYSAVVLLSLLVSLIGIDVNRRVRQVLLGLDLGGVETSATFREVLNAAAYSQVAEMLPVVGGLWKSKS